MAAKSRKKTEKVGGEAEEGNFTPERKNASEGRKMASAGTVQTEHIRSKNQFSK